MREAEKKRQEKQADVSDLFSVSVQPSTLIMNFTSSFLIRSRQRSGSKLRSKLTSANEQKRPRERKLFAKVDQSNLQQQQRHHSSRQPPRSLHLLPLPAPAARLDFVSVRQVACLWARCLQMRHWPISNPRSRPMARHRGAFSSAPPSPARRSVQLTGQRHSRSLDWYRMQH